MSAHLPDRPDLEHLKKLAKTLLRAALQQDNDGLRRLRTLPGLASKTDSEISQRAALHDAQSVIAREHGFVSWNALREEVEARSLSVAAAVDEFVRCATGGATGRARRLLALHPGIAGATMQSALVLADVDAVEARLRDRSALAREPGGPQQWEPLLYVCHTCMHGDRADGLVAIDRAAAEATLAAAPQLSAELRPDHHLLLHRPAESGNVAVLETMLACGFDPEARDKDRVTPLHRAAMAGHADAVRVLLAAGASVDALDGMFAAPPLVWAVEGRSGSPDGATNHVAVARLLIAAGSPLEWTPSEGAPNPERTLEGLLELRRAAEGG
jgi:hypothetical protein